MRAAAPVRGPPEFEMAKQVVEVIGRDGHVLRSYTVALEHAGCIDAEYEEVALVFAERDGIVAEKEHVHLRARCVR
jgi:hypothetical protein